MPLKPEWVKSDVAPWILDDEVKCMAAHKRVLSLILLSTWGGRFSLTRINGNMQFAYTTYYIQTEALNVPVASTVSLPCNVYFYQDFYFSYI